MVKVLRHWVDYDRTWVQYKDVFFFVMTTPGHVEAMQCNGGDVDGRGVIPAGPERVTIKAVVGQAQPRLGAN